MFINFKEVKDQVSKENENFKNLYLQYLLIAGYVGALIYQHRCFFVFLLVLPFIKFRKFAFNWSSLSLKFQKGLFFLCAVFPSLPLLGGKLHTLGVELPSFVEVLLGHVTPALIFPARLCVFHVFYNLFGGL